MPLQPIGENVPKRGSRYRYRFIEQSDERGETAEEGFTLIELLIVIVVLGILAAVTVFALSGTTAKSAAAACDADAQTVNVALAAYNVQNPSPVSLPTVATLVSAGYLQSAPAANSHYSIGLTTAPVTAAAPQSVTVTIPGTTSVTSNYPGSPDPCAAA